jgi:plastocyanin
MIFGPDGAMMWLLALLLVPLFSPPPSGGVVEGRVVLVRSGAALPDASNAVVWVEGARSAGGTAHSTGEMKSEQKTFTPRVVVVHKNASVQFPNADSIYHNAFSVSGANRFDLGLYRSGASREKKFEEPGLVRVYCNIHPQMVGFVMVVDSDFATVTGPDGRFRFEGVPPGAHVVRVWQEEAGESQAPVTVRAEPNEPLTLRLDVTNYRPLPHKNKYGKDYPPGAGTDDERY